MRPLHLGFILLGLVLLAVWQLFAIPNDGIQMLVGPRAVPTALVALTALFSLIYAINAWRGREADVHHQSELPPLPSAVERLLRILIGALFFIGLVSYLGFWLPATLCVLATASAFEVSLKKWQNWLLAAALVLMAWLLFAKILKVDIGGLLPVFF